MCACVRFDSNQLPKTENGNIVNGNGKWIRILLCSIAEKYATMFRAPLIVQPLEKYDKTCPYQHSTAVSCDIFSSSSREQTATAAAAWKQLYISTYFMIFAVSATIFITILRTINRNETTLSTIVVHQVRDDLNTLTATIYVANQICLPHFSQMRTINLCLFELCTNINHSVQLI